MRNETIQRIQIDFDSNCDLPIFMPVAKTSIKKESLGTV